MRLGKSTGKHVVVLWKAAAINVIKEGFAEGVQTEGAALRSEVETGVD